MECNYCLKDSALTHTHFFIYTILKPITLKNNVDEIECTLCCRLGVTVVVVSNERLGYAVGAAQRSIHNNVRDLDTFLANTKMQLRYLVTNSFEQTAEAIHEDLDGNYILNCIGNIIGRVYKKLLSLC